MARQDKKQKTRRGLADAAVRRFTDQGYENVTMADVAKDAGVSRRTAFRYFPSKADLVLEYPREWHHIFDSVIVENRSLSLAERLRLAVTAVGEHIEQDEEPVRLLFGLAFEHASIAGRYATTSQAWIERIYSELVYDQKPTSFDTKAQMIAVALMGTIDAACGMWANGHGELSELLDDALNLAETSLLPQLSRAN